MHGQLCTVQRVALERGDGGVVLQRISSAGSSPPHQQPIGEGGYSAAQLHEEMRS